MLMLAQIDRLWRFLFPHVFYSTTLTSTRLFAFLPSGLELSLTGKASAAPSVKIRLLSIPYVTSFAFSLLALARDILSLAFLLPVESVCPLNLILTRSYDSKTFET